METTAMSRRIQIATLKNARITSEIRAALRDGLDTRRIADFLAAVDWRGVDTALPIVKQRLGLLEEWSTLFAEGDISGPAFEDRLRSLLPAAKQTPERAAVAS